jgi:hypothetical protein
LVDPGPPRAEPKDEAAITEETWRHYLSTEHPHVFYTWTTPEQLAQLRKGMQVLSRSRSPKHGEALFDHVLSHWAKRPGPIGEQARTLYREGFARKRFAWRTIFGAILGIDKEPYGQVLRVVLKPEAFVGEFIAIGRSEPSREQDRIVQDPQRVGAIYYENADYREYVLLNEAMIQEVSAQTETVRREALAELRFLESITDTDMLRHPVHEAFPSKRALGHWGRAAYVVALRRFIDLMPVLPLEVRPDATFALGSPRTQLPLLCTEKHRLQPSVGTFSTMIINECEPQERCRKSADNTCEPVPEAFR